MSLPDLFRNYLLTRQGVSPVTAKNYLSDIRKFLGWFEINFGKTFEVQDLSSDVVNLFITTGGGVINEADGEWSVANGKSTPRSFERYISSLKRFAAFLTEEKYVQSNPFEAIKIQSVSEEVKGKADPWHLKDFKNYLYVYGASNLTINTSGTVNITGILLLPSTK